MSWLKKHCLHCRAPIGRKALKCPSCDRWQDDQSPWASFVRELYHLRGPLILLGLVLGYLLWAIYRLQ